MCKNEIKYYRPAGWDHKEATVKCGRTDFFGDKRLCDSCIDLAKSQHDYDMEADNAWLKSAGWGEL